MQNEAARYQYCEQINHGEVLSLHSLSILIINRALRPDDDNNMHDAFKCNQSNLLFDTIFII
jgi:hypothetical protein